MYRSKEVIRTIMCVLLALLSMQVVAQRAVTPVDSDDLPYEIRLKQAMRAAADTVTTDTIATQEVDTIPSGPLLRGLLITADVSSPIMNLLGTQYGNYEVALELDILHRFFPVLEVGMGMCNYTPEMNNYTFRTPLAPYARLGLNYNFFYKNESESFIGIGLRYGLTYFNYAWDNITLNDTYWDSEVSTSTPMQKAFAHWGEIVATLRVQIYKNFYMGWSGRYRLLINCDTSQYGEPYFIPGFGPKASTFAFTYTIGYNIPFNTKPKEIVSL